MVRTTLALLVAMLLGITACERKASPPAAPEAAVEVPAAEEPPVIVQEEPPPAAEEAGGCGCSPGALGVRVPGLTCDEPNAQTYTLHIRPGPGNVFPVQADIQVHYKFMGAGARLEGALSVPAEGAQRRWLECEYAAGRRPSLKFQFCLLPNSPGGVVVHLTFPDGHVEHLDGDGSARAAQFLEMTDSAGVSHVLSGVSFTAPTMEAPDRIVTVLHIQGTPSFTSRSGGLGDFSDFGEVSPRRRRRH